MCIQMHDIRRVCVKPYRYVKFEQGKKKVKIDTHLNNSKVVLGIGFSEIRNNTTNMHNMMAF